MNSSDSMSDHIGGFPFITKYLEVYVPYSVLSFLGVLIGITGNGLIIISVLYSRGLRKNPTCILITNLAIADFFISCIVNSFALIGTFLGKQYFDTYRFLCEFIAATCMIVCGTSLTSMLVIAINRYISVFYQSTYKKIYTVRRTIVMCILTWILSALIDLPNFFGVGGHVYDEKTLQCIFDRLKIGYTITVSVVSIILPCIICGLMYIRIFIHAFSIRHKVNDLNYKKRSKFQAIKIAKGFFASYFLFAICWIPASIVYIVGTEVNLPLSAHALTNLQAHLNSAMNPIFYAIFNPAIRKGYIRILNLSCGLKFKNSNNIKNNYSNTFYTISKDYRVY